MKWIRRVGVGIVLVVALVSLGFVAWTRVNRYPALPQSQSQQTIAVVSPTIVAPQSWRVFVPSAPNGQGFIFYPGGLVDADAYGWIGQQLAQRGILTVIVPMPLDLAILDSQAAQAVLTHYPEVHTWVMGGHSLGGTAAGRFIAAHPQNIGHISGLVLWGSRLTGIDISGVPLRVVSIYGTRDGIAPRDITSQQRLAGLPNTTKLIPIEGGNHSMFGDYGLQNGDNLLQIPMDLAREHILEATLLAFA